MSPESTGKTQQMLISLGKGLSFSLPDGWSQTGTISQESLEKKLKNKVSWTPPGECRAKIHWQVAKITVAPEVVEFLKIIIEQEPGDLPIEALQPLQPALIRLAPETITRLTITQLENSNPFLYLEYHDDRSRYRGLVCYAPARSGNEGEVQILAYEGIEPFFSRFEEPAKVSLRSLSDALFGKTQEEESTAGDAGHDAIEDGTSAKDAVETEAAASESASESETDLNSGWIRAPLDDEPSLSLSRSTLDSLERPHAGTLNTPKADDDYEDSGEVEYAPVGSVDLIGATRSIIPPEDWLQSHFRGAPTSLLVPPNIISWCPPDTENVIFHWHQRRINSTVASVATVQQLMADQVLGVARQEAVHEFTKHLLNRDDVALNAITIEQFEESGPLLSLQIDSSDTLGMLFLWFDDSNTEVINIIAYEADQDSFVDYYDDVIASIATLTTKPAPPAPPSSQISSSQVSSQQPQATPSASADSISEPQAQRPRTSQDLHKQRASREVRKPTRPSAEFPSQTVKRPTVPDGFLALTEDSKVDAEAEEFIGQLISPDELVAAFPLDLDATSVAAEVAPHKPTMELSSSASKIKAGKLQLTAQEREVIARALDENSESVPYELRPGQTITSIIEDARPELDRSAIIARVKQIYEFNRKHDNPIKAWTLTAGVTVILPSEMFRKE